MANIFKTTLKKDVISDISNNNKREIRFSITKFWATRLTEEYNLDDKKFLFKKFDSLELSSPSNKETGAEIYTFDFNRTYVDGDEFVVEFCDVDDSDNSSNCENDEIEYKEEIENITPEITTEVSIEEKECTNDVNKLNLDNVVSTNFVDEDVKKGENEEENEEEIPSVDTKTVFESIKTWFDENNILENLYENEDVVSTNARQVIVLSNGKILGSKKTLPVNNDAEVRVEFDMNNKVYFDATCPIDDFENDIFSFLEEIRKNNFVFIWKRYTGIFMDDDGVYFGIKYSTRKSIGFNNKYKVQ